MSIPCAAPALSRRQAGARRRRPRALPALEALEDRLAPAAIPLEPCNSTVIVTPLAHAPPPGGACWVTTACSARPSGVCRPSAFPLRPESLAATEVNFLLTGILCRTRGVT